MGFSRAEHLERLGREEFDLLVIGGGITGAGIARDAAMRGLKTALVEARDFASGTSSKSSKLLHGGIRYLEQFQLALVFEASRERRLHSQKLAPHLSRPVPFLIPVYPWSPHGLPAMATGVYLYDALALFRNHGTRILRREQALKEEPNLEQNGLKGGVVYHDVVMDDSRIAVENIRSAVFHGTALANFLAVRGFEKDSAGKIVGAWVRDTVPERSQDFLIKARVTVNATGPWCDYLRRLDLPDSVNVLRPTKGVHLILPNEVLGKTHAFVLTAKSDNRVFFSIPWFDRTLVGTTDTDYDPARDGEAHEIRALPNEVDYLMEGVKRTFPNASATAQDIQSTFAGLRPLVADSPGAGPSQVSREHRIWREESGLFCIAGGKYTTYRTMAQEMVDEVVEALQEEYSDLLGKGVNACLTQSEPLVFPFSQKERDRYNRALLDYTRELGEDVVAHLQAQYGPRWQCVAELALEQADLKARVIEGEPNILAEARYAREEEMAVYCDDYLRRRSRLMLRSSLGKQVERIQALEKFFEPGDTPLSEEKIRRWQGLF